MLKKILILAPLSRVDLTGAGSGGVGSVCRVLLKGLIEKKQTAFYYRVLAIDSTNSVKVEGVVEKLSANVELICLIKKMGNLFFQALLMYIK